MSGYADNTAIYLRGSDGIPQILTILENFLAYLASRLTDPSLSCRCLAHTIRPEGSIHTGLPYSVLMSTANISESK